jgi:hypothetical protein
MAVINGGGHWVDRRAVGESSMEVIGGGGR